MKSYEIPIPLENIGCVITQADSKYISSHRVLVLPPNYQISCNTNILCGAICCQSNIFWVSTIMLRMSIYNLLDSYIFPHRKGDPNSHGREDGSIMTFSSFQINVIQIISGVTWKCAIHISLTSIVCRFVDNACKQEIPVHNNYSYWRTWF